MLFFPFKGSLTRSVSHLEFLSHEMELELSSEVKTNSKVLIPLKAVDLKELIQEDTGEGQLHGECPLETDKVTEKFILKRCASIPFFFNIVMVY